MKPKIVILVKYGKVIAIRSDSEVYAEFEIHDLDEHKELESETESYIQHEAFTRILR